MKPLRCFPVLAGFALFSVPAAASREQCLQACQLQFINNLQQCQAFYPSGSTEQNQCAFRAIMLRSQCISNCG